MKGKSKSATAPKTSKDTIARKNAEAQKAKKKEARIAKGNTAPSSSLGKKGKSVIPQGKKK